MSWFYLAQLKSNVIKCFNLQVNNTTITIVFIKFNLHQVETYRNTKTSTNYSVEIILLFFVIILYLCV